MLKINLSEVQSEFENHYHAVRADEGRILSIDEIKQLPNKDHFEWKQRIKSTQRFINYVQTHSPQNVLDLGCGNGWLLYKIAPFVKKLHGIDINLKELKQAAEVLQKNKNVELFYLDIFKTPLPSTYDSIIINAAVQYFPDLTALIHLLLNHLHPNGIIHIVDSPIYNQQEVNAAAARSKSYYKEVGSQEMSNYYYHHHWEELEPFNYKIAYQPQHIFNRLKRKFSQSDSPFPWVIIKK